MLNNRFVQVVFLLVLFFGSIFLLASLQASQDKGKFAECMNFESPPADLEEYFSNGNYSHCFRTEILYKIQPMGILLQMADEMIQEVENYALKRECETMKNKHNEIDSDRSRIVS